MSDNEEKKVEEKKPAFGGFSFGKAGAFSFSTAVKSSAPSSSSGDADKDADDGDDDGDSNPAPASEEDEKNWRPDFTPQVEVSKVDTKSDEEDEDTVFCARARMYRFDKAAGEWKERGTGDIKILKHQQTSKIRILMRREKILKVCANHYILPVMKLEKNPSSDTTLTYATHADYAEGDARPETLAVRFRDVETMKTFREHFFDAQVHMAELKGIPFERPVVADSTAAASSSVSEKKEESSSTASSATSSEESKSE